MSTPRLHEALPELVREGLISSEQAERITARYAAPKDQGGNRMMLLFSILGGFLIGLGIILVVAHNWDDLGKPARTVFAFLPMAVGQCIVGWTMWKAPNSRGWKEGGAAFLLLAVGACIALVSQIYHIPGQLDGFLLTWSLLTVLLLYVPGSLIATLLYLGMITWYAAAARTEHWSTVTYPWAYLPLLLAALPVYAREWRERGSSVGFFWLSSFMAVSIGIASQLFWQDGHLEIAIGIMGLAVAYCLVPWAHGGKRLRTAAFPFIGSATILGILIFLSYHEIWADEMSDHAALGTDLWPTLILLAIGITAYALALRSREPFTRSLFPESLWAVLLAYAIGLWSPMLATVCVNAWMFILGLHAVRIGLAQDSLPRMNLGLAIISGIIVLRFFDLDINDALKGVVFILLGAGFLLMNVRLIKQRKMTGHA